MSAILKFVKVSICWLHPIFQVTDAVSWGSLAAVVRGEWGPAPWRTTRRGPTGCGRAPSDSEVSLHGTRRQDMETGGWIHRRFPSQRANVKEFWCSFAVSFNELLSKQSNCRRFEMSWRSCDVTVISFDGFDVDSLASEESVTFKCRSRVYTRPAFSHPLSMQMSWHLPVLSLILGLRPANERRRYFVTTSLIGWAQTKNQPCYYRVSLKCCVL